MSLAACGAAAVALGQVQYEPTKVTGGGQAVGSVLDRVNGALHENVPATIAVQGQFSGPKQGNLFLGKGNFQFVDHVTGMCFHARLEMGGFNTVSGNVDILVAPVRDCGSDDGLFDDGFVTIFLKDSGVGGPDKGDEVFVDRLDENGIFTIYTFSGVLESGNIKIQEVKGK
jgi:hypothetical protein